MTKIATGPSLPQARGANSDTDTYSNPHPHRHLHSHIRPRHRHHQSGDSVEHDHAPSNEKQQLHQRDLADLESSAITEVVETVSVVQVVDGSGSPVQIQTYFPESAINPDNTAIGTAAAGSSTTDSATTAAALPSSDSALPSETAAHSLTASALSGLESLTSAPSSTFTSFPSLTGVFNVTSRPTFFNSTARHSLFINTTAEAAVPSNTSLSSSLSTTSHSSSTTLLTSTTEVPTTTVFGNGDGTGVGVGTGAGGAGATLTALPTATSTETSASGGSPLNATTTSLVGGIVGGFAGVALVVLVVLMGLKWKRQHSKGIQLLTGDGPDNKRGSRYSRAGPPGGPGGGHGSWAIPGALASLTGHGKGPPAAIEGPETRERAFYRVSGRKLTSVLESGGDGYGEPSSPDNRVSTISGTSSLYRPDSIAMLSDPKSAPLQLGSPMRPESGILVMRSGPARTPLQEQGPGFDDTGPVTPPSLAVEHDPHGGDLLTPSRSGTPAGSPSPSRFTEGIP